MSRSTNCCKVVLAGCAYVFTSMPSYAATVTILGDNFDLSYDDTQPGIVIYGAPEYGTGTNTISFNQTGFNVQSTDGDGENEQLLSSVEFSLTRHDSSFNFESLSLFEFGNYTLDGPGASVEVTGNISVQTIGFPQDGGSAYVPGPPPIAAITDLTINDNVAHDWFGSAFADLTNDGTNSPFGGGGPNDFTTYDTILVDITNILRANTTQTGTFASIQKLSSGTSVQLGVNGSPASAVPVPAAAWLMISGLLGLFGIARRK